MPPRCDSGSVNHPSYSARGESAESTPCSYSCLKPKKATVYHDDMLLHEPWNSETFKGITITSTCDGHRPGVGCRALIGPGVVEHGAGKTLDGYFSLFDWQLNAARTNASPLITVEEPSKN